MVKCITVGDPHFRPTKHPKLYDDMEKQLCGLIVRHSPDFVVIMGDVFHDHNIVHVQMLKRVRSFFLNLQKKLKTRPLYVLVGNHDMENNSQYLSEIHALIPFKDKYPNLHIIDSPKLVKHGMCNFVLVPYIPPGKFQDALNTLTLPDNISAIFAHQEFYGARLGPTTSVYGDKWDIESHLVISGHVHDAHIPQPNIIYIGTPIQHSYGEDQNKAVGVFSFSSESYEYIREAIIVANHITHHIKLDTDTTDVVVDRVIQQRKTKKDDTHRVIVSGNMADIQIFRKSKTAKTLQKANVKIVYKNTEHQVESTDTPSEQMDKSDKHTFLSKLRERCNNHKEYAKELIEEINKFVQHY